MASVYKFNGLFVMLPFNVKHSLNKTAIITEDGTHVTYGDINDFSESIL